MGNNNATALKFFEFYKDWSKHITVGFRINRIESVILISYHENETGNCDNIVIRRAYLFMNFVLPFYCR